MKSSQAKPALGLLVLALAAAGGWWWWQGRQAAVPAASAPPAVSVTLARAVRRDVPVTVEVNGSVVSLNTVDLRPQVTNVLRAVHVKEGQFVKAGELLFSLDDRGDQANLQKAQAQLQKDMATAADLERQYRRSQDLVAQKFIAQSAADATLSQLEAQRATLAADRAAIATAQVALGYDTLRAPVAGRIGAINIFPGSLVQPATTMVTVTQLDPIAVSFPVPEGRLQDLLAAARDHLPVAATVPGRPEPLLGRLNFVDNTVDAAVGAVRAKAVFANPDQALWPGQYVMTRTTVGQLAGATVLPAAAVIHGPQGATVYIAGADQTAQARPVKELQALGAQVAVQGVEPGESVVVEGKQNLRPGSRLRVDAPAPARAAGASAPAAASGPDTAAAKAQP